MNYPPFLPVLWAETQSALTNSNTFKNMSFDYFLSTWMSRDS